MNTLNTDIAIIGGGLVGASLALALRPLIEKSGCKVSLFESQPPQADGALPATQPSFDARASALSWGTRLIYEQLGLWQPLSPQTYPITHIHVSERQRLGTTHLSAADQQTEALGYVVTNQWMGQTLWCALRQDSRVDIQAPAQIEQIQWADPQQAILKGQVAGQPVQVSARLVVLVDGGRSGLKQQLGIADQVYDYQQNALVTNLRSTCSAQGWAYERFVPQGAMALLPLQDTQRGLVWTGPSEQMQRLAQLDDEAFLHACQQSFGSRSGQFLQVGRRDLYPLKKVIAQEQVRRNLVLLGNAAHYLHPVAGQGYNLAIRGVMSLADWLLSQAQQQGCDFHPGELASLQAWLDTRLADQQAVIGASHHLIDGFSRPGPLLSRIRGLGLLGLNNLPRVKNLLAKKAMGV